MASASNASVRGARRQWSAAWHRFGATTLVVGKGIGASRIPLRIGVRSEIHLLTFC